jgi:hypothetical protein
VDPESAQILVLAITAVAVIVWLLGVQFLSRSLRVGQAAPSGERDLTDASLAPSANRLTGSVEVDGQPAVLSARAASVLARTSPFGPVKIVEKTDDHIVFESLGPGGVKQLATRWFQRGELQLSAVNPRRSRVDWVAELASMSWLLSLGALFLVLGLVAIVVGCWVMFTWVIPSPNLAVRWQAFQMIQVVHFLWPPFVFGALYRRGRREVSAQFEAMANNLPYYGD